MTAAGDRPEHVPVVPIAGIFLFALVLRLIGAGERSLWVDEGATLLFARAPWHEILGPIARHETNPASYYALMKLWIAVAGDSAFALRLPSAVAGAACVFPVYLFAVRTVGRGGALFAAVLVAISALQVEHAREARGYPLLLLVFATGLLAGRRLVDEASTPERSAGRVVRFGVLAGLLPHLHFTGVLAAVVLHVYVSAGVAARGSLGRTAVLRIAAAALLSTAVAAPVLVQIAHQLGQGAGPVAWIARPSIAETIWTYRLTYGHYFLGEVDFVHAELVRKVLDAAMILTAVIAATAGIARRNCHAIGLLVAVAFTMVLFYVVSQRSPVLLPRTVLFGSLLIFPILAFGVASIASRPLAAAAAALIVAGQIVNLAAAATLPRSEDWRTVVGMAAAAYQPGDAVVMFRTSVGGLPLLDAYWPGSRPAEVFSVIDPPLAVDGIGLRLDGRSRLLDPAKPCPGLAPAVRLLVLSRVGNSASSLDAFAEALRASGARQLSETRMGHLRLHVWAGLGCRG